MTNDITHATKTMTGAPMTRFLTLAMLAFCSAGLSAQQLATPVASARAELDVLVERLDEHQGDERDINISLELRRYLEVHPKMVAEIPGILLRDEPGSETSSTLILALEVVGTPVAQRALADIYSNRAHRHMDRLRATIGAGAVEKPTRHAVSSLWGAAGQRSDGVDIDVSNTAILSIGVAGSRLRRAGSADYADVRESLVSSLHTTQANDERTMLLKSIGNLHDPSLGREVAGYLFSESVPVRASAAQALGLMRDVSSMPTLLEIFEYEPRGVVRSEIVTSLRKLPATDRTLKTVNDAILTEAHPEARAQMAEYLVEHLDDFDEARPILMHLFHNDTTQRVRVIASAAARR